MSKNNADKNQKSQETRNAVQKTASETAKKPTTQSSKSVASRKSNENVDERNNSDVADAKTTKKHGVSIPEYTLGEELVNSISHGVGAVLAITGLVFCIINSKSGIAVVASCLYGSMMILLYLFSCLYHALSPRTRGKKVLRVIDHDNVFLMEAGTYMPISLSLLAGNGQVAIGWTVFGIVWAVTIVAVVLSSIDVDKFQGVGLVCNLILGWGALLILPWLTKVLPPAGIFLLIMGGLAYSLGAIWYAIGSKYKWMHSIFHFYVLLGSIFHFFLIYNFCL